MDYQTFYASIDKPFFAPEPWVFGLAWGIIYPLIAVAFLYTLYLFWKGKLAWGIVGIFILNLIANFAFTPLQLNFPNQIYATLNIAVVLVSLSMLQWYFYKHSKPLFLLLLPYLLWGAFATVLQTAIYLMNFT